MPKPFDERSEVMSLLGPLAGAAIAIVTVYLTNRYLTNRWTSQRQREQWTREQAHERSTLLRSRGEELYVLFHQWLFALATNYLGLTSVMQGKLTYNEHFDLMIKGGVPEKFNGGRMEMLIQAYFPSLKNDYDAVCHARTQLNQIAGTHKRAYQAGDNDGRRFMDPYIGAQKAVEAAGETLKEKLLIELQAL